MVSKTIPFFDFFDSDIVPIDYYLELGGGNKYLLPNQPSNFQVAQNTSHEHLYAIDGSPLKRTSDKVMFDITIEGFSGVSQRLHLINRIEKIATIKEILENFEEGLFQFRNEQKKQEDVYFDLYDLRNGRKYHDVHPISFSYVQSVDQSRLGYNWSLNLVCYSEHTVVPDNVTEWSAFFTDVSNAVDTFTAQMTRVSRVIDTVSNRVNLPIRGLLRSVNQAGDSIVNIAGSTQGAVITTRNTLIQAMDTILGAGIKLLNVATTVKDIFTEDLAGAPQLFKNHFEDALIDYKELISEFDTENEQENEEIQLSVLQIALETEEMVYNLEKLIGLYGAYLAVPTRNLKSSIEGGSFLDRSDSFALLANALDPTAVAVNSETEQSKQKYVLQTGDNLYRVAVRLFNDVNRWYEIASLNNWLDANTTADGFPPSAGTEIFVPASPSLLGVSAVSNLVRDTVLLGDLQVRRDDLTFDVVSGEDNFIQAVVHRIKTTKQELVDELEYGLSGLIGNPTRLSLEVVDQLIRDPRVLRVSDVSVQRDGDQMILDLNVVPFEGDSVNIIVPIGE